MMPFLEALVQPGVPFLRFALIAGLLASVAFGTIGSYVVARRISYLAGSIAHCALGGIGISMYLQRRNDWGWLHPVHGAVIVALAAAIIIGFVTLYARQREDTVIGALWSIGMATGLLFLAKTPGYVDPMSYLFGNILIISKSDLYLIAALDLIILVLGIAFYNKFLAVCFDEEFTRLRGINTNFYYFILLCLIALTVVLMVGVAGIVLVIALLTLPAAIASHFSQRLWQMMLLAVGFCMVFTVIGLMASYHWNLPSGPMIIVISGAAYLLTAVGNRMMGRH